jgi:hypothetical protein
MIKAYPSQEKAFERVDILKRDYGVWTGIQYNHELAGWILLYDPSNLASG